MTGSNSLISAADAKLITIVAAGEVDEPSAKRRDRGLEDRTLQNSLTREFLLILLLSSSLFFDTNVLSSFRMKSKSGSIDHNSAPFMRSVATSFKSLKAYHKLLTITLSP